MKLFTIIFLSSISFFALAENEGMKILKAENRTSNPAPAENFTGEVRVSPLFSPAGSSRLSAGSVTFSPSARSAWHTHPLGQALVVVAGSGRVQEWGQPIQEIKEGDVIWTPPGVKHWHGAGPDTSLTHTAIQEALDGKNVVWLEKVTDEQYKSKFK